MANQMLEFVKPVAVHFGLMCGTCNIAGQIILIGDPAHSWLWPLLAVLAAQTAKEGSINWYFLLEATMFQACMQFEVRINGSSHNQSATILGSPGVFSPLAVQCGHSHSHEPLPAKKLDNRNWVSDTAAKAQHPANIAGPSQHAHAQQHRALQQLIPDFEASHWLPADAKPAANGKPLPPAIAGEEIEVAATVQSDRCHLHGRGLKVGVGVEPEAHIAKALHLHHPMDTTIAQLDPLDKARLATLTKEPAVLARDCLEMLKLYTALLTMLTKEPEVLARDRLEMLKLYGDKAADLLTVETELHNKLPAHVQGIVQGKHLPLFGECLKTHSFPDMRVVHDFTEGVVGVGAEPVAGLFEGKLKPTPMAVERLDLSASVHRKPTIGRPFDDHERGQVDRLVELSQEEVEELFLKGPLFSEEEVSTELGMTCWKLTSSFLLVLGDDEKERTIDGYRLRPVDVALPSRLHLGLHYVKVMSALVTRLICLLREVPHVSIQLPDGAVLRGMLSRTARSGEAFLWRCFDLPKAYKQRVASVASLKYSGMGACDSSGKCFYYIGQPLPLASPAGVYSFDEITRALQFLLWEDLGTPSTNFYDGYPTFYFTVAAMNTTQVVSGFSNAWLETCSEYKGSETLNRGLQWAKLYDQQRGGTLPWQWEQPFPCNPGKPVRTHLMAPK